MRDKEIWRHQQDRIDRAYNRRMRFNLIGIVLCVLGLLGCAYVLYECS